NIGPDHLELFGSMEGSAQAKAELLDLLPADGTAIVNADDPYFDYLAARARCRVMSFGFSEMADVRASGITSDARQGTTFRLHLPGKIRPTTVRIKVHGTHNVTNALAASAVGAAMNLSGSMIAQGLSRFRPAAMRSQVVTHHGVHFINDCYNANPASMKAALQLLAQWSPARERIAVLGDMFELGTETRLMHRDIAEGARLGGMTSAQIDEVVDAAAAADRLKRIVRQGDVVLVKASRGMKMEQVVQALTG